MELERSGEHVGGRGRLDGRFPAALCPAPFVSSALSLTAALVLSMGIAGCAGGSSSGADSRTSPATPDSAGPRSAESAAGAPESAAGAEILRRACTACHDLGGLPAFADYWGEPEWRSMIETMIGYGAQVSPRELDVLARYLAESY